MINKKNIILISPLTGIYDSLYKKTPPFALLAICRRLNRNKYNITIIDQKIPKWKEKIKQALSQEILLFGITALTGHQLYYGSLIAKFIKKHKRNAKIVWGGIHSSSSPVQTLKEDFVDYIVIGEGEDTFPQLVEALAYNKDISKIKGIGYKERSKEVIINSPSKFVDINKLENPPYDLVNINEYLIGIGNGEFYIEGARGCPYNCTFCYNPSYNKRIWRPRSPKEIVSNMKHLYYKYGIKNFLIIDDSFFISRKRLIEFISLLRKENLDIKWRCEANISSVMKLDNSLMEKVVDSGLNWVGVGVESSSKRIRKILNKDIDIQSLIEFNKRVSKYNFNIRYNFITGTPWEEKEDMKRTIKIVRELLNNNPKASVQPIYITVPYPNTMYLKQCMDFGFKPPDSFREWTAFDSFTIGKYLPWMKGNKKRMFEFMMYSSYFIDNKAEYYISDLLQGRIVKFLGKIYQPIARFRFNHFLYLFFFEKTIIKFLNFFQRVTTEYKMKYFN